MEVNAMKKKGILIVLLLVAVTATFLFLPVQSVLAQPSKPAAGSGQKIVWKMHQWRPATQDEIPYMQKACDEIYQRSGGRLKIDIYPGFSLGYHQASWLRNIKGGIIDITCIYNPFTAGEEPSFNVLEMPQIWRSREQGLLAANGFFGFKKRVYKKVWGGEMLAQGTILEGGSEMVFTKGKSIRKVEDFRGLKIRVPGGRYRELYTKLGAAPQSTTMGELYMAMKTGVIDGLRTGSGSVYQLKLYEVSDQALRLGPWPALSQDIVVSDRAWNGLSPDLQEVVRDVWEKWGRGMFAHVIHCPLVDDLYWQKKNEEKGIKYGEMPEAELAKVRETALIILQAWVAKEGGRVAEAYEVIKPFVIPQKEPGKPSVYFGFGGK
jgi:TRAP-type C4-dicarboxylate transport system substrate-binding protein